MRFARLPLFAIALCALTAAPGTPAAAAGQGADPLGYRQPPQGIVDMLDAPPTPDVLLSPDRRTLLVQETPSLPPVAELAERELRLAGLRIRPRTSGPSRTQYAVSLSLVELADGRERRVDGLPAGPRIDHAAWSPDGASVAFTHEARDGFELWVLDARTARARRLTGPRLNLAAANAPRWQPDGRALIAALVPDARGPEPAAPELPTGPIVQESLGRTAPARTFQDLLANPHDEALFEHYLTARLARVDLDGRVTPLGEPGLLWSFDPSPDGRFLLVETLRRPYSYLVPAYRFPRRIEVLDRDGRPVHRVADLPLQDEVPVAFGSVATGPRGVSWRDDADATLFWAEALDGGDASREADERDRLFLLPAPFEGEPKVLATFGLRFAGLSWGDDQLALASEYWWKDRKLRTWILRPGAAGESEPEVLWDRSFEDRYGDPGDPQLRRDERGRLVLLRDGEGRLLLIGAGASPEGDRPFLDALDLATKESERLFRSEAPWYDAPFVLGDGRIVVRREAPEVPPNYFVRDLASGELRQVTRFPHPAPQLAGVQKELIRYPREDGIQLTGTLYLPAGWKPEDGPLPTVLWVYPAEFKSADAAGQASGSPYRFTRPSRWSPVVWVTQGYAVLDDPTMPIVGEGETEPNDTYVEQLTASAKAAIDELARRGVADPRRVAVGGHSYGAFTTANLLVHTDLFAAGIAQSGAYNRSLTPFGFQSEERTLWQAPEVYVRMSPFFHAEKVNEPILLVHGEADNNSGTFPLQSERFYNALKGHGATARYVVLPFESHGYRGRESVLHTLAETFEWLERWVKNRPPEGAGGE
jgi:dipeptidyl aminopeptidase/acylaminoacyl peptidase